MMKNKFGDILFAAAFVFLCVNLHGQDSIIVSTFEHSYYENELKYDLIELSITNIGGKDCLFWLSENSTLGISDTLLWVNFFLEHKGDFSFAELVYWDLYKNIETQIYKYFIKKIGHNEKFTFIFVILNKEKANVLNFYKEHVVIVDRKKTMDFLKFSNEENIYYPSDHIVIFR